MKLSQSTRPEYLRANPPVKPRRQTNKKTGKKRKESAKNYFQRLVSNKKMNEEFPRDDQRVAVSLSYVEKEYGKRGVDSVTKSWGPMENPAMACPLATQDLKVNTRNRDAAVDAEHIQYGPLNLSDDTYWLRYSEKWGTTPEVAKKSNCSNCVAFDISPRMKDCMPGKTSDDEGELGYCWMHHFKCHSARTCYTWAAGGPIVSDETSHDWQRKNQPMKNPSSEGFPIYSAEPKSAKNLGMVTAVVQVGRGVVKDIGEGLQDFYRALIGGRQSMTEKRMMLAVAEMHLDLTNAVKQKGGNAIGNVRLDYEHPTQGGDITLIATADALKIAKKNPPSQKKMDKAKKAYKDFNGKDPKEVRTEKVDFGGMLVYLGDCWSIGYRNGKEGFGDDQKYIHEFGVDEETGRTFEEPKLYMTVPDKGKPMLVIKDGAWKIKTDKNGVSWIYY